MYENPSCGFEASANFHAPGDVGRCTYCIFSTSTPACDACKECYDYIPLEVNPPLLHSGQFMMYRF